MPPGENIAVWEGLRLFTPAASPVAVGETFFARNTLESQVVLASLVDASELLRLLLNGGHSAKAGYLAGAFRASGRDKLDDEIVEAMKSAGYDVRERNPFEAGQVSSKLRPAAAPIDDFGTDHRDKVEVFREDRKVIEEAARQKYLVGDTETDGTILIHSSELAKRKRQSIRGG